MHVLEVLTLPLQWDDDAEDEDVHTQKFQVAFVGNHVVTSIISRLVASVSGKGHDSRKTHDGVEALAVPA